jgi:hypothetical protein
MTKNITFHLDYNKVTMERGEGAQKVERMHETFKHVYKELLKVPKEVDNSIEEKVSKIGESMQGFCSNII